VFIFLDESDNIRLHPSIFERFRGKPFVSNKPFLLSGSRLCFSSIFYKKESNFFMNHWSSFEIRGDKGIVDRIHEFDNMEFFL
jgi:hypothetical protein